MPFAQWDFLPATLDHRKGWTAAIQTNHGALAGERLKDSKTARIVKRGQDQRIMLGIYRPNGRPGYRSAKKNPFFQP